MRPFSVYLAGSSLILLASCDFGAGPCQVEVEDPLLRIVEAHDQQTGEPITALLLTDLRQDGSEVSARHFLSGEHSGIGIRGDTLVCSVPCGFGQEAGAYAFTVKAAGYEAQRVDMMDVNFAEREERGPCPAVYLRGSQELTLQLKRT